MSANAPKNSITEEQQENEATPLKPKPFNPMEQVLKNGALLTFPKIGDIVEGVVLERKGPRIFVDLGPLGNGIIYGREFYATGDHARALKSNDTVSVKITILDNEEGYRELSLHDAGEDKKWVELSHLMQEGSLLDIRVQEANRGGLILEAQKVKGFLPTSQLTQAHYPRVDGGEKEKILQELQKLVGTSLKVKIIDVNSKENKLIFSERGQEEESLRTALGKYKEGDTVEGEITGVVDFGAFMKFDEAGLEGLIHISEINWTLIEDPRSVLKPGDRVSAKIIDMQGGKISLSLKALKLDPWETTTEKYKKGDVVEAKITKFNPFGAFAELGEGIQGLVHISEFGTETNMRKTLELEKSYQFKILFTNPRDHKISLGITRPVIPESIINQEYIDDNKIGHNDSSIDTAPKE